ncbi:CocE/NonD family hydrolase [Sporosarcina sp. ZBG7A]|uniref:CocE/NonD family hydrolase n=1 Tax=Sporosarcina sp. ZBG7A TaxID=1582223 RepID=UPI00057AC182|nr:CocE/NonD family hydrolase [Sporosarcina sp. ZBG7A]
MVTTQQVIIDREVPSKMRDGVTLYANIYRPSGDGIYPVVLTRLPYNKNLPDFSHRYIDPIRIALSGYVVIIQDVRGRFASEGEFAPFIQEFEDGYDTVEWAAKLPYSNGKVGMFGLSYYGFTQLYAALERPPSLKVLFPAMTGNVAERDMFSRNGVVELASAQTWMLDSISYDYLKRVGTENYEAAMKEIAYDLDHIEESHKAVPFNNWPPIQKHPELVPFFEKYFLSDFQKELQKETKKRLGTSNGVQIPAYHLAGWYDSHLAPTLKNFEDMQNPHHNQKLIVGPWSHGYVDSDIGERAFGSYASGHAIEGKDDITSLHIDWFNYWLKEEHTSIHESEDPVKLFVMGTNEWRSEKEWPLKRTEYTPLYTESDGLANTDNSAGRLTWTKPAQASEDQYVHDPENPVPSRGGGTLFYKGRNSGPRDQREIETRSDVAVYTTTPLSEPVEVTGWITMKLWASSDAVDTDFTAKLVDVLPDGTAYNLADGIVRAKYRQKGIESVPLAGEVVGYEIDLWATSNVFLPGHAIRLEIASSNFPRYEVNPNTGNTTKDTVEMVKANQVIHHGAQYPTHIVLPVIPK